MLERQALMNGQGPIIIAAVPATGDRSLVGTALVDAGQLTVLGVYRCLIPLAGMTSALQVFLTATFASGTVSSDLDTLYWVRSVNDPSGWTKKTAGASDGAMSTTVLQSATISSLAGEQWAILDITLATAAACTFTRAEFCGK
jgi:hypothetical protein